MGLLSLTGDKKTYQSGKHHVSCNLVIHALPLPTPPPLPLGPRASIAPFTRPVTCPSKSLVPCPHPPFLPPLVDPLCFAIIGLPRSEEALLRLGLLAGLGARITTFEWISPLHTHGGSATDAETLSRCLPCRDRVRIPPCFFLLQRRDVLTDGLSMFTGGVTVDVTVSPVSIVSLHNTHGWTYPLLCCWVSCLYVCLVHSVLHPG